MECICPLLPALANTPPVECPENLGQWIKLAFQRKSADFSFATEITAALLVNWTPLIGAVDDDKIVLTHFFSNHLVPQAEPITEGGGDNTTIDGVEDLLGYGPITVTGTFRDVPNDHITALKLFRCENTNIFPINNNGRILAKQPGGAGNPVFPIPIATWSISDAASQGLNTRDKANFRYSFVDGWREDLILITPTDFNAKTDLGPF